MATEEQTLYDTWAALYNHTDGVQARWAAGQKLTISDRLVSKVGFWLSRVGSPTGNIEYRIRKVSDNSLIASKVLADASTIALVATYYEVTLDAPVLINEQVRMFAYYASGADSDNYIRIWYQLDTNPKAAEQLTIAQQKNDTTWDDTGANSDTAYSYTYITGDAGGTPAVFPVDAITRVTGLIHRYSARDGVYQLEISLGDVASVFQRPYSSPVRATYSAQEQDELDRFYKEFEGKKWTEPNLSGTETTPSEKVKDIVREIASFDVGKALESFDVSLGKGRKVAEGLPTASQLQQQRNEEVALITEIQQLSKEASVAEADVGIALLNKVAELREQLAALYRKR